MNLLFLVLELLLAVFAAWTVRVVLLILRGFLQTPAVTVDFSATVEGPDLLSKEFTTTTRDGLKIAGTWIHGETGAPVVVFCHEFGATRHSWSKYLAPLQSRGVHIVAFDARGCGQSEAQPGYCPSKFFSPGELLDLEAVAAYIAGEPALEGRPVGLFGVSRGGATALAGACRKGPWRAVIVDSAFSTWELLMTYTKRWGELYDSVWLVRRIPNLLFRFFCTLSLAVASLQSGRRFPEIGGLLRFWQGIPLLLIHGRKDRSVPHEQADRIAAWVGPVATVWKVDEARHNGAVLKEPEAYAERVCAFFEEHLRRDDAAD